MNTDRLHYQELKAPGGPIFVKMISPESVEVLNAGSHESGWVNVLGWRPYVNRGVPYSFHWGVHLVDGEWQWYDPPMSTHREDKHYPHDTPTPAAIKRMETEMLPVVKAWLAANPKERNLEVLSWLSYMANADAERLQRQRYYLEEEVKEKQEKIETLRSEECVHLARANELTAQIEQLEATT